MTFDDACAPSSGGEQSESLSTRAGVIKFWGPHENGAPLCFISGPGLSSIPSFDP